MDPENIAHDTDSARFGTNQRGPKSGQGKLAALKDKGFSHPIVFTYKAWNSDILLEPDEVIIDVMGSESPTPNDVGKLLVWLMTQFEDFEATPSDTFFLLRKAELENAYISLLKRAIGLAYPRLSKSGL